MKGSVLLVGNFLSSSIGVRFYCEDLAERLRSLDWSVLTSSTKRSRLCRMIDMVCTVWVRRKQYSIAHVDVYSGGAFLWAEVVCCILNYIGKPYILTLHGGDLPSFGNRWPKRLTRLFVRAVAITTPSPYLFKNMQPFRSDLCLLPNAIDLAAYTFTLRNRTRPHLIWLRSFHSIYNPCLALKALTILIREFPGIHLTMIGHDRGDGSLQDLQRLSKELQLEDQITLTGAVSKAEISDCLSKGDIFLNTSIIDNTPVTVLEAMACGLCIISTNVGGIPHLLSHDYNALLVVPDDHVSMAAAIRRVLTEPGLARKLSLNGRRMVEGFDWSIVLPRWNELLESASTLIK